MPVNIGRRKAYTNTRHPLRASAVLALAPLTIAAAQGPGTRPDASGGPVVGDPIPRIELQRLDDDGTAKPGARESLADPAKKRPVVLIFSSFT